METTYLMSNRRKKFHLSHVLFELSDFEESATEKSQNIK